MRSPLNTSCRWLLVSGVFLVLVAGCDGVGFVGPEREVTLQLQGTVRDAGSGAPIANARVSVVLTENHVTKDLTSVKTNGEGHYTLTHRLRGVANERQFRDSCTIWHRDKTTSVWARAAAEGYWLWADSGSDGVPELRCTDAVQTLNFRLRTTP
jgi:hypothetical protein